MARIRTIKPEFPHSESMGRVSRDARLLFINMWTIADDAGRLRANSRMLASLLFPYDDDVPGLIDGWLSELEREGCVRRYVVDGTTYAEITNWLEHQKIDRASASRLPAFDESSREIAKPREASSTDLGPRTLDQGPVVDVRARDPRFHDVGKRVLELCGDSPNLLNYGRVDSWLKAGADPDLDIYPVVASCIAKLGRPPNSMNYFDNAVADAVARRTRPMPEGKSQPRTRSQEQSDAAALVFGRFDQYANDAGDQPRPTGNPRLLSAAERREEPRGHGDLGEGIHAGRG